MEEQKRTKIDPAKLGRCSWYFYHALKDLGQESMKRILDIGCGTGRTFRLFDMFGEAVFFGLDIDSFSLEKAKVECLAIRASGEKLPFAVESFDLIIEFHTMHHIKDYKKVIKEACRCLTPGGHFLMVEAVNDNPIFRLLRNKHPITDHMPIESNFTFAELENSLEEAGFSVKTVERFGVFFEFTLGGIPGLPLFLKRIASAMDAPLEKLLGDKYCASCVVLAKKK